MQEETGGEDNEESLSGNVVMSRISQCSSDLQIPAQGVMEITDVI
jgi:hypothetical protein